ncbi:MAG: hypothetical protein ACN6P1_22590 [Pseudomonas sp.]|uniref:hypothetical protein n=1 Tax=Pseudomonas sp. TaxID=306 RepID=UPI003D0985D9
MTDTSPPYGPKAYDSRHIPQQPPQIRQHAGLLCMPLPWGNTQEVAPMTFIEDNSPAELREEEEEERKNPGNRARKQEKFHNACDHIRYRQAQASAWTQLWVFIGSIGKGFFLIWTGLLIVSFPLLLPVDKSPWLHQLERTFDMWLWVAAPSLLAWLLAHIAFFYLPRTFIVTPSKGPLWELNRQTGMVTVFAHKPGQFKEQGYDGDFIRPFHEFDAYVHVLPTRQGMPLYSLHLVHRYQLVAIDFMPLIGRQSSDKNSLALWDMWQNYMDISKPLPDIPALEEFRHLDPTTIEDDRRTGRNPRHWRDMDDRTFKAAILAMQDRTNQLDALRRPNLMAQHVQYL